MGEALKAEESAPSAAAPLRHELPSGRSVIVRIEGREELEIRSPSGAVEVRVAFDDTGPVVTVKGGRLELAATDVAVKCDRFDVEAREGVRIKSPGDVRVNGATIRLNCTE